jgi:hypothetical protein
MTRSAADFLSDGEQTLNRKRKGEIELDLADMLAEHGARIRR